MRHSRRVIVFGIWMLTAGTTAGAQTAADQVVRPDLTGSIGWQNTNKSELDSYNDWYNRGVQGAVSVGWYWSAHLKTELEAAASSRVRFYTSRNIVINGIQGSAAGEYRFGTRRVTLGQYYQFGENAWFHPHVGAGVDVNWEKTSGEEREFVFVFDPITRIARPTERRVVHPHRTDLHVRPFAAAGFKSYITPRGFFRSDLRVVFGQPVEEVVVRFGFGVDF